MKKNITTNGLGLIVPVNIEALCVHKDAGAIFKPAPYNFSRLPNAANKDIPNLSERVMTGDSRVAMPVGVHLHWALPDGLTHGSTPQAPDASVAFPDTPDRWLITRIYTDLSDAAKPVNRLKSWVIESNFISKTQPDPNRESVTVPFKTDDGDAEQYRFMGRVLEYEKWAATQLLRQQNPNAPELEAEAFVDGLSAVGYGSPDFSASYQNCKSIFGFHDTETDLDKLGENILLSYQITGWYHDPASDPLWQLPLQFDPEVFESLLNKITDPAGKELLAATYTVRQPDGPYVIEAGLSRDKKIAVGGILKDAGFSFLDYVLEQCSWSLPSGTKEKDPDVTQTILAGLINNITWNKNLNSFREISDQMNIAIGNTASQALAALIGQVSGLPDPHNIETLLDALQLGKLKGVTNVEELNRLEDLAIALHTSSYNSGDGGHIWEVKKINDETGRANGMSLLAGTLGDDLNRLNDLQLEYDTSVSDIESLRSQIFMDWYRFMLIFRRGNKDPDHGMDASDIASMIIGEMETLKEKIDQTTTAPIEELAQKIRAKLPEEYQLTDAAAARYWQPAEPVVLFQGKDIKPPERYGGDGRFMADKTMVCRLSSQIITSVSIPAGLIGNSGILTFNKDNTPGLSQAIPLDYSEQIRAVFTESLLLNQLTLAVLAIANGATSNFATATQTLRTNRQAYITPSIPDKLSEAQAAQIRETVSADDADFLFKLYIASGNEYKLNTPVKDLGDNDRKRLVYIFISIGASWSTRLSFQGFAPSDVYFVEWNGNPWLPYSFSWNITYYPFADIDPDGKTSGKKYSPDFILNNFKLGDVSYELKNDLKIPTEYQSYKNEIFMSPHAEENFQVQIRKFLEAQPLDPIDKDLKKILGALENFPPVLSQSLNGLNSAMIMRKEVMQLQIHDPAAVPPYSTFTNVDVKNAVGPMTQTAPSPGNFYNPLRAGLMSISSLTIVDVFGRNIEIRTPEKLIVANNLTCKNLPVNFVYLEPRLVQPARLAFRWLAAANNKIETNSHPATSPICGWILANHLDSSLWFYDQEGNALGSLILSEDLSRVVWQGVPGSDTFGLNIREFFASQRGMLVNGELKKLAIALFNDGNGAYLNAFMRSNDITFNTIQPQSFRQTGSNAVLVGTPIAVTQARLSLDVKGGPAFSNGWTDLRNEVNDGEPKNDRDFTKIKFPVRLGNMQQTEDGLLGYFKDGDYGQYYVMKTNHPTDKVKQPDESTITLTLDKAANETTVTMLMDPRGAIHATSGVLPVKKIDIPPAQFADALENLRIAFLTTPVLYNNNVPAFPVPPVGESEWTWLQNELTKWSASQTINPVDDRANMTDPPQEIREGWLLLSHATNQQS
jgi:hypothetical protein